MKRWRGKGNEIGKKGKERKGTEEKCKDVEERIDKKRNIKMERKGREKEKCKDGKERKGKEEKYKNGEERKRKGE